MKPGLIKSGRTEPRRTHSGDARIVNDTLLQMDIEFLSDRKSRPPDWRLYSLQAQMRDSMVESFNRGQGCGRRSRPRSTGGSGVARSKIVRLIRNDHGVRSLHVPGRLG